MSACHKLTDAYIFVMLLLFPLFTGFHGYEQITASKFFFFLIATAIWLALLIVFSIAERNNAAVLRPLAAPEIAALAFAAVCIVSALVSEYFPETLLGSGRWDGLATLLLYVLIFLAARRFGRLRASHLYAAGAAILLQSAVASMQMSGGNPLGLFPGDLRWADANLRYSGVFLGTIGNVDLLTSYLCLFIPLLAGVYLVNARHWPLLIPTSLGVLLLLYSGTSAGPVALLAAALAALPLILNSRNRLQRFFTMICAVLMCCAVYASIRFQDGRWDIQVSWAVLLLLIAALLCAAASAILYHRRRLPDRDRKAYLHAVLGAEALTIAAALALILLLPGESGTLFELRSVLRGELRDSFGSSRIRIWRETLALVPQRPLLGGGPGTLALRLKIDFERFVPETGRTLRSFVDNAHNVYLGFLADTGVLGLLAYCAMIVCSLTELLKHRTEPVRLAMGFALLCSWIADFFGLGLCLTAPLLWLLWGLSGVTERQDAPGES